MLHADIFFRTYTPKQTDIVVEVGACEGEQTPYLADMAAHVYALEPHPDSYMAARQAVGDRTNVTLIHCASARVAGVTWITDDKDPATRRTGAEGIPVAALPLDTVAPPADYLKINAEGAELDVLLGYGRGLDHTRHICVSCHDFLGIPTLTDVRDMLNERGFHVQQFQDDPRKWAADYLYASRA